MGLALACGMDVSRKMISIDPINPATNNSTSSNIPHEIALQKPMNDHVVPRLELANNLPQSIAS